MSGGGTTLEKGDVAQTNYICITSLSRNRVNRFPSLLQYVIGPALEAGSLSDALSGIWSHHFFLKEVHQFGLLYVSPPNY